MQRSSRSSSKLRDSLFWREHRKADDIFVAGINGVSAVAAESSKVSQHGERPHSQLSDFGDQRVAAVGEGPHEVEITGAVLNDLRRLSEVTHHLLLKRTQLALEEKHFERGQELLSESTDDLKNALDTAMTSDMAWAQRSDLAPLHAKYLNDYHAVLQQEPIVRSLKADLDRLEFELANRERAIEQLLVIVANVRPDIRSRLQGEPMRPSNGSARSSESDTPPLLAAYWNRKGDVRIFQERLDEVNIAFAEGRAQREFIADRGDPLNVSDQDFDAEYLARRAEIQKHLEAAELDASKLKVQCEEAGHNTEAVRRPSITESELESYDQSYRSKPSSQAASPGILDQALVDGWLAEIVQPQDGLSSASVSHVSAPQMDKLLLGDDVPRSDSRLAMQATPEPTGKNAMPVIDSRPPASSTTAASAGDMILVRASDAIPSNDGAIPTLPRKPSLERFRLRKVGSWFTNGSKRLSIWSTTWLRKASLEDITRKALKSREGDG